MPGVTSDLLQHTRLLTVAAAVSTAHWMWGNLYEEIVTTPPALTWAAGSSGWVGPLDLGSPVWYYGPTLPLSVVLVWVLAARLSRESRAGGPRRPALWLRRAGYAITAAGVAKVSLILFVNSDLRDPDLGAEVRHQLTALWLTANGAVVLLLAFTLVALLAWRRVPVVRHATQISRRSAEEAASTAEV